MPNIVAYIVLFGWPVVVLFLYSSKQPAHATVLSILGAYLLLPVHMGIDLPFIPPLDKYSLPSISALAACFMFRKARRGLRAKSLDWPVFILLIYVLAPFATALTNGDSVRVGSRMLAPMTYYDALSTAIQTLIYGCIPFWLGYANLKNYNDVKYLFKALVVGGLFYSLLILIEVRLSPQLHTWVYGFFPHEFYQQMRLGGFRPVVFLGHGLIVAFFAALATAAASGLWRMRIRIMTIPGGIISAYLWFTVFLCKSMASMVYASFLLFTIRGVRPLIQVRIAIFLALFVLLFPALRVSSYFPTESIVDIAKNINPERADSLRFRFEQEQDMIIRARQRPWFGWGSWGRYRTYAKDTGEDISVTDSRWFITFGQSGVLGFTAEFGLMMIPVLRIRSAIGPGISAKERTAAAALALIVAIVGIENLVNDSITSLTLLFAGALTSYGNTLRMVQRSWRQARRVPPEADTSPTNKDPEDSPLSSATNAI